MSAKWILLLGALVTGCNLGTVPTKVDPDFAICQECIANGDCDGTTHPEQQVCIDKVSAWCAKHPDDEEWCSDAGQPDSGFGDGGGRGDAGCCDDPDGNIRSDGGDLQDGGCKDCTPPPCSVMADCASNVGGAYCSPLRECVQCLASGNCTNADPVCTLNKCIGCSAKPQCADRPATPACDVPSGDCVECTASDAAHCVANSKVCLSGGTRCVECNGDGDCSQPGKAKCDTTTHSCVPCDSSSQCEHVTVGDNSNLDVCNAGSCVECTPATEGTECGPKACEPQLFTCTSKNRNSVATCGTCSSDSECIASHKCVQVPFNGVVGGFHCMRQTPGCTSPYLGPSINVASKNGLPAGPYCAHNTNVTTCQAVLSLTSSKSCTAGTVAADCGPGSRCEIVNNGAAAKCTYACSSDLECPSVALCNEQSSGEPYCGGSGS